MSSLRILKFHHHASKLCSRYLSSNSDDSNFINSKMIMNSKLIHALKSSDDICRSCMKAGHFMIFHKSSFLANNWLSKIKLVTYNELHDVLNCSKEILNSSVFLGFEDDITVENGNNVNVTIPIFATQMYPNISIDQLLDIGLRFNGNFDQKVDFQLHLSVTKESEMILKANSLFRWHRMNKFCPSCGKIVQRSLAGYKMKCDSCKNTIYCQAAPTIHVLLVDEENSKVLLVKMPQMPPKVYSIVAGFVDIGETAEEAVKREVMEELGVCVKELKYVCSAPWMMKPNPLLLGFIAKIEGNQKFDLNPDEIENIRWVTRETLKNNLQARDADINPENDFHFSFPGSLADILIKSWLSSNDKN